MKILFVCGSLESGKDGVGDYTRVLAQKLTELGCSGTILSLNDTYVSNTTYENIEVNHQLLKVIRIPSIKRTKERYRIAKKIIFDSKADVVSLQFVPYSFHAKGLPFSLISFFKAIEKSIVLNIMFHEIWLDKPIKLKDRIIALLQRNIISRLCKRTNLINATIPYNKIRLQKLNIKSSIIPLFGNIPNKLNPETYKNWNLFEKKKFKILYFGAHPRDEFKSLLIQKLERFCANKIGEVVIVCACGNSKDRYSFINLLKERLLPMNIYIEDTGFISENEIDFLMNNCSVGISRAIPEFIGKSGTAIAMLERGLPVWLPKATENKIMQLDFNFRKELLFANLSIVEEQAIKKMPYYSQVSEVANFFLVQFNFIK